MQPLLMWGLYDGTTMHIVDTMAQAYVVQKENPEWGAYVLRIPESGFWDIVRGPITILRKGRLYGDPVTDPFLTGLMMHLGHVGCAYFVLLSIIEANSISLIIAGLCLILSATIRRYAARDMKYSIEYMERFMAQVREITGPEGIEAFAAEFFGRTKGVGHGG